ncbi:MAG TPA: alanine--tRNA ligase [Flavipsychrobacter sp.]|nr:alanine--tRNA ligase [Flavipsychrobacter sp.]
MQPYSKTDMLTAHEIRQQFLDFFSSKQHTIVPSAPIVIKNDPTLLFTNAGMNQFKDCFLGNKTPESTRIADSQKCLRVSGKHNDLEEVGVDTYHHTMFEMLGNWSFGDYFKKEAIAWSWELLTEVYKIPKDRLYVTVFEGDEKEQLAFDQESYDEWKKWIAKDRILKGNKKDNFWEMGDTGPCGPCSEIHVDCRTDEERKQIDGSTLVNNDHPQVIEIWNNVFMEFNRLKDGSLQTLPAKHVDTGMGFERLVRVLQEKQSNYDTDIFTKTIYETEKIVGKKYDYSDTKEAIAFRVIADHIRAIAFTIADGQLPSNTGAGYVIRRILRRAARYYYSYLDYKQPLLTQLIPSLALQFETVFPELQLQVGLVSKVIKEEEEAFLRTLDKGIKRFEEYFGQVVTDLDNQAPISGGILGTSTEAIINQLEKNNIVIDGKFAFELNDTYGFPIDLTQLMAQEVNATVDIKGFEAEMQKQKDRSRAATAISADDWVITDDTLTSEFIGYTETTNPTARILKHRKVSIKGKEVFQIILDKTPFYAESGGQVGDSGTLRTATELIHVLDTKKENGVILHFVDQLPSNFQEPLVATIDTVRRKNITIHHSATHLLHAALRQVLGTHVAQKGSLVQEDYLRFDFSHFAKVSSEEIATIEALVNEKIRENIPVVIKEMSKDEAVNMGAMALFGEKYGDTVRVVIIDPNYSIELCGGTHIGTTGEIGLLKIKHETAVAAGVRRIEALGGEKAEAYVNTLLQELEQVKQSLKNAKEPLKAIEKLYEENNRLQKHIERLEARTLVGIRNELLQKDEIIGQVSFIGDLVEVGSADALKKLCTDLKNHIVDHVIVLGANIDGKPFIAIGVSETVIAAKGLDATKLIKEKVAGLIKGGGGGQKTLATAGGQEVAGLQQAIDAIKAMLL